MQNSASWRVHIEPPLRIQRNVESRKISYVCRHPGVVIGDWWLVVGGWWLVVGGWWLVVVVGGGGRGGGGD